jgi:hypothetical protein
MARVHSNDELKAGRLAIQARPRAGDWFDGRVARWRRSTTAARSTAKVLLRQNKTAAGPKRSHRPQHVFCSAVGCLDLRAHETGLRRKRKKPWCKAVEGGIAPGRLPGEAIAADDLLDARVRVIGGELRRGPESMSTWQRLLAERDAPDPRSVRRVRSGDGNGSRARIRMTTRTATTVFGARCRRAEALAST